MTRLLTQIMSITMHVPCNEQFSFQSVSGKTLPDWVNSQIYDDLQYLNAMDFHFKNYNDQMKKLRAGKYILKDIDNCVKHKLNLLV